MKTVIGRMIVGLALTLVAAGTASAENSVRPGNLAYLDASYGFRGVKFETPFSSQMELVLTADLGDAKLYTKNIENLTMGDGRLKSILYTFYKGKFEEVVFDTSGFVNSRAVLAVLEEAYGKRDQPNEFMENWYGQRATVTYREDSYTGDAVIAIWSKKVRGQEKADKKARDKAQAKKGVGDL